MRTDPIMLQQRMRLAHNTVLINKTTWENLTKEQIEALNQLLDHIEVLKNNAKKWQRRFIFC